MGSLHIFISSDQDLVSLIQKIFTTANSLDGEHNINNI